jgi:hypothetical protein
VPAKAMPGATREAMAVASTVEAVATAISSPTVAVAMVAVATASSNPLEEAATKAGTVAATAPSLPMRTVAVTTGAPMEVLRAAEAVTAEVTAAASSETEVATSPQTATPKRAPAWPTLPLRAPNQTAPPTTEVVARAEAPPASTPASSLSTRETRLLSPLAEELLLARPTRSLRPTSATRLARTI